MFVLAPWNAKKNYSHFFSFLLSYTSFKTLSIIPSIIYDGSIVIKCKFIVQLLTFV